MRRKKESIARVQPTRSIDTAYRQGSKTLEKVFIELCEETKYFLNRRDLGVRGFL